MAPSWTSGSPRSVLASAVTPSSLQDVVPSNRALPLLVMFVISVTPARLAGYWLLAGLAAHTREHARRGELFKVY